MPHAGVAVAHDHARPPDPGRGVFLTLKQIFVGVLVGAILATAGYVFGLGTHDAVQQTQLETMQKQLDGKVDRGEFSAFVKSVDGLTTETRLLRDELAKTREELAAQTGRLAATRPVRVHTEAGVRHYTDQP